MFEFQSTIICLGSNTAGRASIVCKALTRLMMLCRIKRTSGIFVTPDYAGLGCHYANIVVECEPLLDFAGMRRCLKELETSFGRNDDSKPSGIMPLDADIIVWHGSIVDDDQYHRPYFQEGLCAIAK